MEPWLISTIVQLLGFAAFGGAMWAKFGKTERMGEANHDLLNAAAIASAVAKAELREVILHAGDLEIRVRRLESEK